MSVWEIGPSAAEMLAGRRLDRRRSYAIDDDGELLELARWTDVCTGCQGDAYAEIGMGCHECGYHGRVRQSMWVPVRAAEAVREVDREMRGAKSAPVTRRSPDKPTTDDVNGGANCPRGGTA